MADGARPRARTRSLAGAATATLPGLEIRTARDDDVAELVGCYEWLFAPPGSKPAVWNGRAAVDRLREAVAAERSDALVAEVDGAIAGFVTIYLDVLSVRFGQRAWIEDMAVAPAQRSRGIGAALLDAAKRWAREHGASHVELDSGLQRESAHRFYEREGAVRGSFSFRWEL